MDENGSELKTIDRLKLLYPNVTEPLPLCWSSTEKNNSIGLSNSNLRVHYKGTMIFTFSLVWITSNLIFIYAQIYKALESLTTMLRRSERHVTSPPAADCTISRWE